MLIQAYISILLFSALAVEPRLALPSTDSLTRKFTRSRPLPVLYQHFALSGRIENNNGKLRLVLSNGSPQEFRGTCRISLGGDGNQKEIGQVELTLPPQETVLLQVSNVPPSGDQYTMAIFDQKGARRFFKIAPLGRVTDPTPAVAITLTPIQQQRPKTNTLLLAVGGSIAIRRRQPRRRYYQRRAAGAGAGAIARQ